MKIFGFISILVLIVIVAVSSMHTSSVSTFNGTIYFQSDKGEKPLGIRHLTTTKEAYVCDGHTPVVTKNNRLIFYISSKHLLYCRELSSLKPIKMDIGNIKLDAYSLPKIDSFETKIAFIGRANNIDGIYILDINTKDLSNLTNYETKNLSNKHYELSYDSLSWFPDSKRIAFILGRSEIVIKDINADIENVVAKSKDINISNLRDCAVSPDGKNIAFTGIRGDSKKSRHYNNLFILNIVNNSITPLTNNNYENRYPTWSPDGKEICFTSFRHGGPLVGGELYIINLATKKERRITKAVRTVGRQPFSGWTTDSYPCWVR